MNRSSLRRRFAPFFRAFGAALLLAVTAFAVPAAAAEKGLRMTPEQRREAWERMTPQQRQQWRNSRIDERQRPPMPGAPAGVPEQRPDARGHFTFDERQAMRQRFLERQQNRALQPDQNVPPRRQLSPEERQQLREQIEQARGIYRRGDAGNRGANK